MNKLLQLFNFLGVIALTVLCVMQFRANSSLHQDIDILKKLRNDQIIRIESQEKAIKGRDADIEELRHQLSIAQAANDELTKRLAVIERDLTKAVAERDRLSAEIENWKNAVQLRDDAIKKQNDLLKEAGNRIDQLIADRNDDIHKFNDLVAKYNLLVKQVEQSQHKDNP